jgi:hypothetical protein
MRKLTVKNFSVIKEAELEFGKITVLIGPQSSGKSLLCKLAFFFAQVVPEIDYATLPFQGSFGLFQINLLGGFIERFPKDTWSGQAFQIAYTSIQFDVTVKSDGKNAHPSFEFNSGFSERYDRPIQISSVPTERMNAIDLRWIEERILDGLLRQEHSVYIPTGRAFFSTPNKGFASFSGKNLDWITQRFSTEIDFSYRNLIESSDTDNQLLIDFWKQAGRILGGTVVDMGGLPYFKHFESKRELPFELQSSGTLELLPLLNPLGNRVSHAKYPDIPTVPMPQFGTFFVEEPESSVFPSTQHQLVKLFSWLANESAFNISLTITTHSPYILTAFNNLIEAGQAARNNPKLHDEVAKIIPEQYWIKEGDFRAYAIEDGKLRSILNESGFIEGNYLDQVSEVIGNEFDKLLRLEYEHTKAS